MKNPVGRPEKPDSEKTVKLSVSVSNQVYLFLQTLLNRSQFVNQAIVEKIQRQKIR